jgi:hypothetical protein
MLLLSEIIIDEDALRPLSLQRLDRILILLTNAITNLPTILLVSWFLSLLMGKRTMLLSYELASLLCKL